LWTRASCRRFLARIALTPDAVAYQQYDVRSGGWVVWTRRKIGDDVDRWRGALQASSLQLVRVSPR
jgi:hypothetical protein